MKKVLVTLVCILTISFGSCYQTAAGSSGLKRITDHLPDTVEVPSNEKNQNWEIGMLGGLLFSSVRGDMTELHSYIPNFNAGIYASTDIFPPLGFRLELYYAGLGTGFASIADSKLCFNYIVLPAKFTYDFNPAMTLGIGPYFGYLINARSKGDDIVYDISDTISRLDIGAKIGVYFQISPATNLSISFQRGFLNTQSGQRAGNLKQYNQCVIFNASFNLGELLH